MKDKKKAPIMVKCPGSCGKMIRADWGHACGVEKEQRTELVREEPKIGIYLTEKDVEKRINFVTVRMLQGLSKLLEVWGDMECKGGGMIDPTEALFHCRACTFNGIRHHVDQAIERWKRRS
jgi:hypothetical protein